MSKNSRFKKRLYAGAVALGLAVGSVGIAAAATSGSADATAPADDATEVHEPAYTGSVQAPAEDGSLSDADEAKQLEPLATISAGEAATAATEAVPGDVGEVELENENGSVVYSVEVTDAAGAHTEVTVDAGDGSVLSQQADDGEDEADHNANEVEDDDENGSDNEAQHGTEVEDD
ncbi:MAG: hypothetical protein BMS9Abin17_0630 [Acidimicrobiia bacterium]|nr:MAG: hypothetical protein BMS9Abin17_0630 [Acidimicrobiia bacterium]